MNFKIPSIEEIYNEYHRQTFFFLNGIYPRPIKNFDNILSDPKKKEYLLKFQNMISRNRESVDWKIYIYACASLLKKRFDLKILGSLAGNKLYRNYIDYTYNEDKDEEAIFQEIIRSLKFLNFYFKENDFNFESYCLEGMNSFPLCLKHIYAGTVSLYFYAAMAPNSAYKIFHNYTDDIFQEYFQMTRNEFLSNVISVKRDKIIRFKKIRELCDKLEAGLKI